MKKVGQKIAELSLRFMNVKWPYLIAAFLLLDIMGWAAPQPYSQPYRTVRPSTGEDLGSILRQLRNGLADLKHEMRNQEAEIHLFENKLQSQESAFEDLRQQLNEEMQSQLESVKASIINLEGKTETLDQLIKNLDNLVKGLTSDARQIKTQTNESITVLGQYKQKISELEGLLQTQNQHMQTLELAMQSMMEVWQAKETASKTNEILKTYKVQPGDSLEKIARIQKVSVQALREANQLTNDRIIVGQILKIP